MNLLFYKNKINSSSAKCYFFSLAPMPIRNEFVYCNESIYFPIVFFFQMVYRLKSDCTRLGSFHWPRRWEFLVTKLHLQLVGNQRNSLIKREIGLEMKTKKKRNRHSLIEMSVSETTTAKRWHSSKWHGLLFNKINRKLTSRKKAVPKTQTQTYATRRQHNQNQLQLLG